MDIYFDRIKPLFVDSGLSDVDLEKNIGLPRSSIYDWDKGRSKAYKKYADKIAEYFNVSTDYLLGISDSKVPEMEIDDDTLIIMSRGGENKVIKLSPEKKEKVKKALQLVLDDDDIDF